MTTIEIPKELILKANECPRKFTVIFHWLFAIILIAGGIISSLLAVTKFVVTGEEVDGLALAILALVVLFPTGTVATGYAFLLSRGRNTLLEFAEAHSEIDLEGLRKLSPIYKGE